MIRFSQNYRKFVDFGFYEMSCQSIRFQDQARSTIVDVLESRTSFQPSELAVRINSVSSGLADQDLSALFSCKEPPKTLVVPKVDNVEEVDWVSK